MTSKTWVKIFLIAFCFFMISTVLIVSVVDPYQYFGKNENGFSPNQRFQIPGLINSYLNHGDVYDSVLIGTSLSENFYTNDLKRKLGTKGFLKLTASGAVPLEQFTILEKAIKTGKVKTVLWEIALHKYAVDSIHLNDQVHTMPFEIYNSFIYPLNYLFSKHVVNESFKFIFEDKKYPSHDLNSLGNWQKTFSNHFVSFASKNTLLRMSHNDIVDDIRSETILGKEMDYPEIDTHLLPVLNKHQSIMFYLYIPPYNKAYYFDKSNELVKRYVFMANYLMQNTAGLKNVKLFGFDDLDLTFELSNYRDSTHYSEDVNKLIISRLADGKSELNHKSIVRYTTNFVDGINQFRTKMTKIKQVYKSENNNYFTRVEQLKIVKFALEQYFLKNKKYPISVGFDGYLTDWGKSGEDWIVGLVPEYLEQLPRDPRLSDNPRHQYLYKSNGTDYKLIVNEPEDCIYSKGQTPHLIDLKRNCWAYGYWTNGASKW